MYCLFIAFVFDDSANSTSNTKLRRKKVEEIAKMSAESVEHKTLRQMVGELSSFISADPAPIAWGLYAKGVISDSTVNSVNHKDKTVLAYEIVLEVLNKVKLFPETFHTFLTVLKGKTSLLQLAKLIEETYDKAIKEEKVSDHHY